MSGSSLTGWVNDGRSVFYRMIAWDEAGKIGEGAHERFIVDNEKFLAKANAR